LLNVAARQWRNKHGAKRATNKSLRKSWCEHALELAQLEFPQARGKISADDVKKCTLKRTDRVTDFVSDKIVRYAELEMTQHALE
jgi:hypothetical protein